jgi:hypothetical protein
LYTALRQHDLTTMHHIMYLPSWKGRTAFRRYGSIINATEMDKDEVTNPVNLWDALSSLSRDQPSQ